MGGRTSSMLLLMVGVCSIVIWAGYYNPTLDFGNVGHLAGKFPLGPHNGPLAVGFGSMLLAWLVYSPAQQAPRK